MTQAAPRQMKPNQADTLGSIRAAAFSLFGTFGYDGVSIGDIAKATSLSKGALYWHYAGKDALYIDCLKQLHAIFDEHVFGPMEGNSDPIQALLGFFHGMGELVEDPRVQNGVAGYWMQSNRTDLAQVMTVQQDFESRNAHIIQGVLELASEQGVLDFAGEREAMARAMVAVMEAIVLPLRQQTAAEVHQTLGMLARTMIRAYTDRKELVELFRDF